MKKRILLSLAAVCLLTSLSALAQQAAPAGPPPMLQIFREEVKAGHRGAYLTSAAAWPVAFRKAQFPGHYIGLRPLTGSNEFWYLGGASSFGAIGKEDEFVAGHPTLGKEIDAMSASDGEHLANSRTLYAEYVPEFSYNTDFQVGKARHWRVITTRIRPGRGREYGDMMKKLKATHEKAGMSEHYLVYAVTAGAPSGTYLMFIPSESAEQLDALGDEHAKKLQPLFTDEDRATMTKVNSEIVMFSETNFFAVAPAISYPRESTVAADPAFWNPQPVVANKKDSKKKTMARE